MSRLLAFGCSHTYGHGLEDCLLENNEPALTPSKFAFPSLLADMLNIPCINLAEPGSSNQDILRKILGSEIRQTDIIIVLWTHYSRDVLYVDDDSPGSNRDQQTGLVYMPVGNWMINNPGYTGVKKTILSYYLAHQDIDQQVRSWIAKHHVDNYLSNLKVKNYLFLQNAKDELNRKPTFLKFNNLQNLQLWSTLFEKHPRAPDGNHPGPEAHKEVAELMYNKINNDCLGRTTI